MQIPDDTARELVEAYIKDPKAVEKQMRVHAPVLKRGAAPKGKVVRKADSRMVKAASAPARASVNGHVNGSTAAAAPKAARGKRVASAAKPSRAEKPRRATAKSR